MNLFQTTIKLKMDYYNDRSYISFSEYNLLYHINN